MTGTKKNEWYSPPLKKGAESEVCEIVEDLHTGHFFVSCEQKIQLFHTLGVEHLKSNIWQHKQGYIPPVADATIRYPSSPAAIVIFPLLQPLLALGSQGDFFQLSWTKWLQTYTIIVMWQTSRYVTKYNCLSCD